MEAHRPIIYNVDLSTPNSEESQELPQRTVKVQIQSRNNNDLKLAWVAGESGSNYFTIKGGMVYFESEIFKPDGQFTVYLQSDTVEVAEIQCWTYN